MKKVSVLFIQDRSGSMGERPGQWLEYLNGFKEFVNDLKSKAAEDVEYTFSLTVFDTVVDHPVKAIKLSDVDVSVLEKYPPRGGTALYDAVGTTIVDVKTDADKIICIIVTDGEENSSKEWSKDALNQLISEKLDSGIWTFTYLGTQPETWDEAQKIGISAGATVNYQASNAGATYTVAASAVNSLSASDETQSRALFASHHVSASAMRAAGMTTKRDSTTAKQRQPLTSSTQSYLAPKPSAKKPKPSKKPWR